MSHGHHTAPPPLRACQPGADWNDAVPHLGTAQDARHACKGAPAATTFQSWDALRSALLSVPDERPRTPVYVPTPFPAAFHDNLRRRAAQFAGVPPRTNDALLEASRWLFWHHRSAVIVCIRGDRLWFLPYVNTGYRNTWQHARVDQAVRRYCAQHRPRDAGQWDPDITRWWSNGKMLCTGVPRGKPPVGDRGLLAWVDLLRAAMAVTGDLDATFVLNRRDCQMLPRGWRDGRPADDPFGDADPVPPPPPGALPVFSSYVRHGAADDVGFVEPSQWAAVNRCHFPALHGQPPPAPFDRCAVPMAMRAYKAGIFRGSITSQERYDLIKQAWRMPFVDVAATGYNNHRLKVDGGIMGPTTGLAPEAVGSHHFVDLEAQFARYGVQIVADGHAAADRLFHVLRCSGGAVAQLVPSVGDPGGAHGMWFSDLMVGDGNCPVVTCGDVPTLVASVKAMYEPDPGLGAGFAAAAAAFADRYLTRQALVEYTAALVAEVAAR